MEERDFKAFSRSVRVDLEVMKALCTIFCTFGAYQLMRWEHQYLRDNGLVLCLILVLIYGVYTFFIFYQMYQKEQDQKLRLYLILTVLITLVLACTLSYIGAYIMLFFCFVLYLYPRVPEEWLSTKLYAVKQSNNFTLCSLVMIKKGVQYLSYLGIISIVIALGVTLAVSDLMLYCVLSTLAISFVMSVYNFIMDYVYIRKILA